jgi:hypothetical protein
MHGGRWSERFAETVLRATKEGRGIFESTSSRVVVPWALAPRARHRATREPGP